MGQPDYQPAPAESRRYSVTEYMLLEEESDVRHEFFEGEIFAMAGGSIRHNLLVLNCAFSLRTSLRDKKCLVVAENVQLAVERGRYYNYPDIAVTCDPTDLAAERTIGSPVLLIEVTSKSTERRDRSWKFERYKELPSLRHYLLVSQKTSLVEWYKREESGVWSHHTFTRFADELYIPEIDATLKLQDIYARTGLAQMTIYPDPEPESEQD